MATAGSPNWESWRTEEELAKISRGRQVWFTLMMALWCLALVIPWMIFIFAIPNSSTGKLTTVYSIAGFDILATIVVGIILGGHKWWMGVLFAAPIGTTSVMVTYVITMTFQPGCGVKMNCDNTAVPGLAIFAVPVGIIVLALVSFGAILGTLFRRIVHD